MLGPEDSDRSELLQLSSNLDSMQPPQIATEGVIGHEQLPVTQVDVCGWPLLVRMPLYAAALSSNGGDDAMYVSDDHFKRCDEEHTTFRRPPSPIRPRCGPRYVSRIQSCIVDGEGFDGDQLLGESTEQQGDDGNDRGNVCQPARRT